MKAALRDWQLVEESLSSARARRKTEHRDAPGKHLAEHLTHMKGFSMKLDLFHLVEFTGDDRPDLEGLSREMGIPSIFLSNRPYKKYFSRKNCVEKKIVDKTVRTYMINSLSS